MNYQFKIGILSEWYLENQRTKFFKDAEKVKNIILKTQPYKKHKEHIVFKSIFKEINEPNSSLFETSYGSLDIDRYITSKDEWAINNVCTNIHFNAIIILCNSKKYGGGGIYGKYTCVPSDNDQLDYLVVHELGHSIAGLADEYYASSVTYLPEKNNRPWEPNISTLDNIKWHKKISASTPIPTPWNKTAYDLISNKNKKSFYHKNQEPYEHEIGVFQGAGYDNDNLYRSQVDCVMFSKNKLEYCKICSTAIEKFLTFSQ